MEDVLKLLEELVHNTIKDIRENQISALKYLEVDKQTIIPEIPFPRYTYEEIIDLINKRYSIDIEFGEDISTEAYRKLGKELSGYYYITHWPMSIKPFYIMPSRNPKYSESFDLQKGMLELTSGGTRVHNKDQLINALEKKGLNYLSFTSHLDAFDYGMPPHAGFGLGIDRWLTILCGLDDIREAVMYPRTPDRLTP
jgi:aspartyl-tRNA synthetase